MTNAELDKLKELAERATQNKIQSCPNCGSASQPIWTERSPDGRAKCSACKEISSNLNWIAPKKLEFAVSPDVVLKLIAEVKRLHIVENVQNDLLGRRQNVESLRAQLAEAREVIEELVDMLEDPEARKQTDSFTAQRSDHNE